MNKKIFLSMIFVSACSFALQGMDVDVSGQENNTAAAELRDSNHNEINQHIGDNVFNLSFSDGQVTTENLNVLSELLAAINSQKSHEAIAKIKENFGKGTQRDFTKFIQDIKPGCVSDDFKKHMALKAMLQKYFVELLKTMLPFRSSNVDKYSSYMFSADLLSIIGLCNECLEEGFSIGDACAFLLEKLLNNAVSFDQFNLKFDENTVSKKDLEQAIMLKLVPAMLKLLVSERFATYVKSEISGKIDRKLYSDVDWFCYIFLCGLSVTELKGLKDEWIKNDGATYNGVIEVLDKYIEGRRK